MAAPASAPPPTFFLREDLSKPENRINVAMFGLLLIDEFRRWLLERLGLPIEAIVYPPINTAGNRPDYVVVCGGTVVGWIEVERLGPDAAQLSAYGSSYEGHPVKCITGFGETGGDLSLKEVEAFVTARLESLSPQQQVNARVLLGLIEAHVKPGVQYNYTDPGEWVLNRPLLTALHLALGDRFAAGAGRVAIGTVHISTITDRGWTIRVYAKGSSMASVAVLWDQSQGAGSVRAQSFEELDRCLPGGNEAVASFATWLKALGTDIRSVPKGRNLPVSEQGLLTRVDELAGQLLALATVYSGA